MISRLKTVFIASLCITTFALAKEHHVKSGEFYLVTKALMTTSMSVLEGEGKTLKGGVGRGIGVDVGYTLPYHFAVEVDTSYSKNSVLEAHTQEGHTEYKDADALYWTYSLDMVYSLPIYRSFGLMGKVGYEFEHEEIKDLHINTDRSGVIFGAGIEYHLSSHYEAVLEYEKSSIESPRGRSIYAGIKYIF